MPTLEDIRACFSGDRFATEAAGVEIQAADPGHSVCTMAIRPVHLNANSVSITFLSPSHGKTLIAEARCIKAGRTTCLYAVDVTDDLGAQIAHLTVNGYTMAPRPEK